MNPTTVVPQLRNQYLAGLLTLAITVLTAAVAIPEAEWFKPEIVWQFAGMVVSTVVVIFLPLSKGPWAGALKVGGAIVTVIVSQVVSVLLADGVFNFTFWMLLGLAVLNVIAAELGVQARVGDARVAVESPEVDTATVVAVDPLAVRAAQR